MEESTWVQAVAELTRVWATTKPSATSLSPFVALGRPDSRPNACACVGQGFRGVCDSVSATRSTEGTQCIPSKPPTDRAPGLTDAKAEQMHTAALVRSRTRSPRPARRRRRPPVCRASGKPIKVREEGDLPVGRIHEFMGLRLECMHGPWRRSSSSFFVCCSDRPRRKSRFGYL